ncbi:MAG TPA: DUF835 domain-containing protein, partial [Thermoplasmata archaeon]|nr:DUF835 domain-containing protein [Thermoplasmata archaeon]
YLDLEQTPALESEGFSREIIRRVQQMRKDMGLNVEEFIRVEIECSRRVEGFLENWKDKIARETRARHFEIVDSPRGEYIVEWNIESEAMVIGLTSLKMKQGMDTLTGISGISSDKAMKLVDAGYSTIDHMKEASAEDFAIVEGVTKLDAKRIYDSLHKDDVKPAAAPAAPAAVPPQPGVSEQAPPAAPAPQPQVTFLERLRKIEGLNPTVALAVYEAGYVSGQTLMNAAVGDLMKVKGVSESTATMLIEHFISEPSPGAKQVRAEIKPAPSVTELERSFSYLVEEDKPEASYSLFLNALNKGMKGYCITRNYPAKIKSKFDLKETPVIWLSNVGRENAIRPKDLEKLSVSLEQFLSQPGGGIVLLDGLEYLITNNNFITVLRLIQSLRDQVAINQSILLMAVNRSTLESHQLNLLEREVDYTITG